MGVADVFCEADQFFVDDKGNYNYDGMKIQEAHADCLLRVKGYLELGKTVVVSNTFTRYKELHPYIEHCQQNNIPFTSVIVENRHGNNSIHNVPEDVIEKMRQRFTVALNGTDLRLFDATMRRNPGIGIVAETAPFLL